MATKSKSKEKPYSLIMCIWDKRDGSMTEKKIDLSESDFLQMDALKLDMMASVLAETTYQAFLGD